MVQWAIGMIGADLRAPDHDEHAVHVVFLPEELEGDLGLGA